MNMKVIKQENFPKRDHREDHEREHTGGDVTRVRSRVVAHRVLRGALRARGGDRDPVPDSR